MRDERSAEGAQRVSLAENAVARRVGQPLSESHESPALLLEVLAIEGGAGPLGRERVRVALQRHCEIAELAAAHLLQHDFETAAEVADNAPISREAAKIGICASGAKNAIIMELPNADAPASVDVNGLF